MHLYVFPANLMRVFGQSASVDVRRYKTRRTGFDVTNTELTVYC